VKYLGIDYGERNIGLAGSSGSFSRPFRTIKYKSDKGMDFLIEELGRLIKLEKIKVVVIGLSEGRVAKNTRRLGKLLEQNERIRVVFWDETLTSKRAVEKMVEAGMRKNRRRKGEHSAAAALILQDYKKKKKD